VTRPDDSSLNPEDRRAVEKRAHNLLDRASAWDTFPTPIDDILATANLKVAPASMFDPDRVLNFIRHKVGDAKIYIKSALSKVLGIYDSQEHIIHIDNTVVDTKQNFLKLHETGHHELPTHRKLFKFFEDCRKTLSPQIADQFEREANNFARFVLFQGDTYAMVAADSALEIKTPMTLAKKFGASQYASAREFARTNHRACVVYVLEPIEFTDGYGAQATVRRIEASPSFISRFGKPSDTVITLDHVLGPVLPVGLRMTRPVMLSITDLNGDSHECVAEAFDTTYNVLILLYPVHALRTKRIIVPRGFESITTNDRLR
jgi:hypothetical protein